MHEARALALLALACCLPQEVTFAKPGASSGAEGGGGSGGAEPGSAGGGAGGECDGDGGAAGACSEEGGGGSASCGDLGDCRACLACSQRSTCQAAQAACDAEPDCVALNGCIEACPPDDFDCFLGCHGAHRVGSKLWVEAVDCVLCECSVPGFAAPCDQDAAMFCR